MSSQQVFCCYPAEQVRSGQPQIQHGTCPTQWQECQPFVLMQPQPLQLPTQQQHQQSQPFQQLQHFPQFQQTQHFQQFQQFQQNHQFQQTQQLRCQLEQNRTFQQNQQTEHIQSQRRQNQRRQKLQKHQAQSQSPQQQKEPRLQQQFVTSAGTGGGGRFKGPGASRGSAVVGRTMPGSQIVGWRGSGGRGNTGAHSFNSWCDIRRSQIQVRPRTGAAPGMNCQAPVFAPGTLWQPQRQARRQQGLASVTLTMPSSKEQFGGETTTASGSRRSSSFGEEAALEKRSAIEPPNEAGEAPKASDESTEQGHRIFDNCAAPAFKRPSQQDDSDSQLSEQMFPALLGRVQAGPACPPKASKKDFCDAPEKNDGVLEASDQTIAQETAAKFADDGEEKQKERQGREQADEGVAEEDVAQKTDDDTEAKESEEDEGESALGERVEEATEGDAAAAAATAELKSCEEDTVAGAKTQTRGSSEGEQGNAHGENGDACVNDVDVGAAACADSQRGVESFYRPRFSQALPEHGQELRRLAMSHLNKVAPENLQTIANRVLALDVRSVDDLNIIVCVVMKKALTERHYSETYSDLIHMLQQDMVHFPPETHGGKAVTLKSVLLNVCQTEFESIQQDTLELTDAEKEGKDQEEVHCLLAEKKSRCLAFMRFIGNLYLRELLHPRVISDIVGELTKCSMDGDNATPSEHIVECLCELLFSIGFELDNGRSTSGKQAVQQVCGRLKELKGLKKADGRSSLYSSRINFLIQDVVDARASGWQRKSFKPSAQTKDELRKDAAASKVVVAGQKPKYLEGKKDVAEKFKLTSRR